jgi:hypothetical protein
MEDTVGGHSAVGEGQTVFFLLNLVQDVNIVRSLVYLTARETKAGIAFLLSESFLKRDRQKIWQSEVARLAADTGGAMFLYGSPADALAVLEGEGGLIFAASESNLRAHHETSGVFEISPPTFLRVTLQHGFECIGFLQSREHVLRHGRGVRFAADLVCSWFEERHLTSLAASERAKLQVTGPPILLQVPGASSGAARAGGLVCENLHSVRLTESGNHRSQFMDDFWAFCANLAERGETVTLRPHPGGQYLLKNRIMPPRNVLLNSAPLYDFDMRHYRFGISAPSTIIFDMICAGIPVAVWRDEAGVMDASNYAGLTEIRTLEDWLGFERDVELRRDMILDRQDAFLKRLPMPLDPSDIYRRFARLIVGGLQGMACSASRTSVNKPNSRAPRSGRRRPLNLVGLLLAEAN